MRVAYILQGFPQYSETFIAREIHEMKRLGVDAEVCSLDMPTKAAPSEECPQVEVTYGCRIPGRALFKALRRAVARHPLRLARVLFQLCARTALDPGSFLPVWRRVPVALYFAEHIRTRGIRHLHAHFAYLPADVAAIISRMTDIPFSVSAHAWDIHAQRAGALRRRLKGASLVAACSRNGLSALQSKVGKTIPLVLAPHGIPLDQFTGERDEREEPLVLAVGRLVPKKGYAHLLRACGMLLHRGKRFKCAIVGAGPEEEALRIMIDREELGDEVDLLGALSQRELLRLYRQARVFVQPSVVAADGDRDGIPNALVEAMAMGVPAVGTSVGGIPEVIEHEVTGIICKACPEENLAVAIGRLLDDEALRTRFGTAARQRVATMFDVRTNVTALANALGVL